MIMRKMLQFLLLTCSLLVLNHVDSMLISKAGNPGANSLGSRAVTAETFPDLRTSFTAKIMSGAVDRSTPVTSETGAKRHDLESLQIRDESVTPQELHGKAESSLIGEHIGNGAKELGTAVVRGSSPLETSQAKWLGLRAIHWVDKAGGEHVSEAAYRKTAGGESSSTGKPDSVGILALVSRPERPLATILVHQFRPPVDKIVVEFPAGLVDKNESVQKAALRELHEETGYGQLPDGGTATIDHVSDILVNDPSMSDANMVMTKVSIQLNHPDIVPVPHQEPDENIHVQLVPLKDLYNVLTELSRRKGYRIDASLMYFAWGLAFPI